LEWATRTVRPGPVKPGVVVLVAELVEHWLAHCETWYTKNGKLTSGFHSHKSAAGAVAAEYGATPVEDFTPDDLRAVRAIWVHQGLHRLTVNTYQTAVKKMFGWGVGKRLVPPGVWHELQQVERLQRGRTKAPERKKKRAAPWADVEATFPHLHERADRRAVLEAMVRVHWLLGCRPQDLCGMRPRDIDRTGDVWHYVPGSHKNEHRDQELEYWIGPKAQAVLAPLLAGCPDNRPVFAYPRKVKSGGWIAVAGQVYCRRVKAACVLAGVRVWTPHQLRHSRATEVMRIYESDQAAATIIGDTTEVTRRIYADNPGQAVARRIARATG
jgi:integrase